MIEAEIREWLMLDGSILALVKTGDEPARIYPLAIPPKERRTCIAYTLISTETRQTLTGHDGLVRALLEIKTWGNKDKANPYELAKTLADLVRKRLDPVEWVAGVQQTLRWPQTLGSYVVHRVTRMDQTDLYEAPVNAEARGDYGVSQDFQVWYTDTV
jgi:hypothetical protein